MLAAILRYLFSVHLQHNLLQPNMSSSPPKHPSCLLWLLCLLGLILLVLVLLVPVLCPLPIDAFWHESRQLGDKLKVPYLDSDTFGMYCS